MFEGGNLPEIPVLEVGESFPLETLERAGERAQALLDSATKGIPAVALRSLDTVSRRWLEKWNNPHLAEIETISRKLGRPGAYFLSVNYEWGCTCTVRPSPDGRSARLIRVLDWRTRGLGRNVIAARVRGAKGPFTTLTWPGYTGVLQAMAPGRFSAALNQAPMRSPTGLYALDWAANRRRVWRMPHPTPGHLLRQAFETTSSFAEAKKLLTEAPVSTPAIFLLAGVKPGETVAIERSETRAAVREGAEVAANHWQSPGWRGRSRGIDSAGRARRMAAVVADFETDFAWLTAPILNPNTRLVMIADAAEGRLIARGYEEERQATALLRLGFAEREITRV